MLHAMGIEEGLVSNSLVPDPKESGTASVTANGEDSIAAAPVIQVEEVCKRFDTGPLILDSISFAAQQGDLIALLGPSGCGKSTLLKAVAGLIPLSSGTICVEGSEPTAEKHNLGFVFQEANLLPWLTSVGNVELPLRIRGLAVAERRARAVAMLERVGLGHALDSYPRQLSGGMKMRVSIARALANEPNVLLLDEPFGALDEMTRDDLNEDLLALRQRDQWTALFVTHSVSEAVFLSSRVLVLAAQPGRIHADIPVDLEFPRTAQTRQMIEYQRKVAEVTASLHSLRGTDS